MKKIILAIMLAGSVCLAKAQKEPLATAFAVPVDTITNLITYEKVIEVQGVSAAVIYKRINEWFQTYFVNPAEVIRENDSVKFVIAAKPRFRLTNISSKDGAKTESGAVQYSITVSAREGRYKYELTAFNWKQQSYYPSEKWMDTKAKTFLPIYNDYLQQLDKYSLETINSLKNAVAHEKAVKDKDKW